MLSEIIARLIREIDGVRNFCGFEKSEEDFQATVILAQACAHYLTDLDEEVNWDNETTCYNCRYRRWTKYGFSCYKDFPVDEKIKTGEIK